MVLLIRDNNCFIVLVIKNQFFMNIIFQIYYFLIYEVLVLVFGFDFNESCLFICNIQDLWFKEDSLYIYFFKIWNQDLFFLLLCRVWLFCIVFFFGQILLCKSYGICCFFVILFFYQVRVCREGRFGQFVFSIFYYIEKLYIF